MSEPMSPLQRWILECQQTLLNRRRVITMQPAVQASDGQGSTGSLFLRE